MSSFKIISRITMMGFLVIVRLLQDLVEGTNNVIIVMTVTQSTTMRIPFV